MSGPECGCGNSDCRGVEDNENHQCGGPGEACCTPLCPECWTGDVDRAYRAGAEQMRERAARVARAYLHVGPFSEDSERDRIAEYSNGTASRIAAAIESLPIEPTEGT